MFDTTVGSCRRFCQPILFVCYHHYKMWLLKRLFFLTYSIAKHHLKQTVQFYLTLAVPAEYSSGNEIIAG